MGQSLFGFLAQRHQRIEHQPVDLQALAQGALAGAEGALGGNADLVDALLLRRRLDVVDQPRDARLERVGRPQQVGAEGTVVVVACCRRRAARACIISASPKPL